MAFVFVTIPLMVLAVAIATVPPLVAMRVEAVERRGARRPIELHPARTEQARAA